MIGTDRRIETDQGPLEMPTADSAGMDLRDTQRMVGPPPEAERLPLASLVPNPGNPRHTPELEIDELAANIRKYGLMQPVLVRRLEPEEGTDEERYEIIAGHRRRLAFVKLREDYPHEVQWRTVPAVIRRADDEQAYLMLLSSQLHTRNFTPREEAMALERFSAAEWKQEAIAAALNKSVPWVSKRRRVYEDPVLSGPVQAGQLRPGVADDLIGVPSAARRQVLAEQAIQENWGQDEVRQAIRQETPSKQVAHILRSLREVKPLLRELHPDDLSANQQKELWDFRDELTRLAQRPKRGEKRQPVFPAMPQIGRSQENAQAGRNGRKRKPGLTFRNPA